MQARFSLPLGSEYRRVPSRRHTMSSRWPGMNCSIHLCSWKTDLFKLSFRFLFSVVNSTLTQPNYRGSKYWCRKGSMLDALSVSNRESRMYQSQINWKRSKWWFPKRWEYGRIHALHQCTWDPCIGGHTPRYLLHWEYYFIISYFIFFSSASAETNCVWKKFTWIMIYRWVGWNQRWHTLTNSIEFHFPYIIVAVLTGKYSVIAFEVIRQEIGIE